MPEESVQITLKGDPQAGEVILGFPEAEINVRMDVRGALELSAMLISVAARVQNAGTFGPMSQMVN